MAIPTCPQHKIVAAYHCPVCHKGLCSRCKTIDGCCSKLCLKRRQKFWAPVWKAVVPRQDVSLLGLLLRLVVLAAILYGVARWFGRI
jgi:hypothetical protein